MQNPSNLNNSTTAASSSSNNIRTPLTSQMPPVKDATSFRYHRLERDNQYTELQVNLTSIFYSL